VTVVEPVVEAAEQAVLERLLAERAVRTVFQPLVSLDSGQVRGFEALSRGPAGSVLERPDLLFAAARRARRLRDLDIACRTAALTAAKIAGLTDPYRLFINAEPEALDGWRPSPEHEHLPLTVVLELTERALTSQPAQLLQTVARVRALGWGVALDDVGADPASLALLPLVQPDVIKLDLALIQDRPSAQIAAVVNAVHAEAERSGTVVLAEGIETAEHLRTARALGATVGQGWYFGRPGPLASPLPAFGAAAPLQVVPRRAGTEDPSPFHLAAAQRPVRNADKRLLIEISKQLEAQDVHVVDGAGGRRGDPADGAEHCHEEGDCGELQVVGEQVDDVEDERAEEHPERQWDEHRVHGVPGDLQAAVHTVRPLAVTGCSGWRLQWDVVLRAAGRPGSLCARCPPRIPPTERVSVPAKPIHWPRRSLPVMRSRSEAIWQARLIVFAAACTTAIRLARRSSVP